MEGDSKELVRTHLDGGREQSPVLKRWARAGAVFNAHQCTSRSQVVIIGMHGQCTGTRILLSAIPSHIARVRRRLTSSFLSF